MAEEKKPDRATRWMTASFWQENDRHSGWGRETSTMVARMMALADEETAEMRETLSLKICQHADLMVKVVLLETKIEHLRIVCPVHGIPDCSPLLNGCSIPVNIRKQIDKAIEGLTGP